MNKDFESKEYTNMKIQKEKLLSNEGKSTINIRCTPEDHDAIANKAKSYGMSISEYVRFVSLNAKITVTTPKK